MPERWIYYNPNYANPKEKEFRADWVDTFDKYGVPEGLTGVILFTPSVEKYKRFYHGFTGHGLEVVPFWSCSPRLCNVDDELRRDNPHKAFLKAWRDIGTWRWMADRYDEIDKLPRTRNIVVIDTEPNGLLRIKDADGKLIYNGGPQRGGWRDLRVAMRPFLQKVTEVGAFTWVCPCYFNPREAFILDAAVSGRRLVEDYAYLEPLKDGQKECSWTGHDVTDLRKRVAVDGGDTLHGLYVNQYEAMTKYNFPLWFYAAKEMRPGFGVPTEKEESLNRGD